MEAKDTVMSDEVIEEKYNCTKTRNSTHYALVKAIAHAQAEISFKAGQKSEMETMVSRANVGLDALAETADPYWKGYWKGMKDWGLAKLKEWGIDR